MRSAVEIWRRQPRFFGALGAGALGTGAAYVAVMLVAYERLGSAWASAAVLLAETAPGMLAGPLIGAWLDRRDRLRCAIAADVVRALAFAALIFAPGIGSLLAVALVTGLAATVFRPAAFALLPALVSREHRMAATAMWGALTDAGTMLGPALAAAVLVLGGASWLLAGIATCFAVSAALFTRVRLASEPERDGEAGSLVDGAREGLRFVARDRVLRVLVGATGVIVLAAAMMNVAEVLFARRELGVSGAGFAALVAVFGVGAVLGSLLSARSTTVAQLKRGYLGGLVLLGGGLLATALAPSLMWALVSFFASGFGNAVSMTHDRGLLQELVPGRMLSRTHALIGSIEAWGFAGAALLGGTLGSLLGARGVFAVSGLALLAIAGLAARALAARHAITVPVPQPSPS